MRPELMFIDSLTPEQRLILAAIALCGPHLTTEQVQGLTGLDDESFKAAWKPIQKQGLVYGSKRFQSVQYRALQAMKEASEPQRPAGYNVKAAMIACGVGGKS